MDVVSYVKLKAMETLLNGAVNDTVVIPVDVQNRLQQTIQTQAGVTVAPSGNSTQASWIDTDGYDKLAVTQLNDGAIVSYASVLWSNDGTNIQGSETIIQSASGTYRTGVTDTKARYAKVQLVNSDAAPRVMSAWAYLKA